MTCKSNNDNSNNSNPQRTRPADRAVRKNLLERSAGARPQRPAARWVLLHNNNSNSNNSSSKLCSCQRSLSQGSMRNDQQ